MLYLINKLQISKRKCDREVVVSKTEGTTQQGGQHLPVASKMGGTTQRGGTNSSSRRKWG